MNFQLKIVLTNNEVIILTGEEFQLLNVRKTKLGNDRISIGIEFFVSNLIKFNEITDLLLKKDFHTIQLIDEKQQELFCKQLNKEKEYTSVDSTITKEGKYFISIGITGGFDD